MIIAAPLILVGLVAGYWIRRWTFVAIVFVIGFAVSLFGWLTGWAASPDTPALGGAIILAIFTWIPLAAGAAIGVCLAMGTRRS